MLMHEDALVIPDYFYLSIMTNTVNSMTAAFGKQIENLSKQSSLDQYEFSGIEIYRI